MSRSNSNPARIAVPNIKRGDTYQAIRLNNIMIKGEPAIITEVRSQIRATKGSVLVHEFETDFTGNSLILKLIHHDVTANFPIGACRMDIEITTENVGRVTIVEAALAVNKDVTYDD